MSRPARTEGVALISALLLVALATATAVLISTRTSLRLRAAENAQALAQAQASAQAAIDFGRWALRQDQIQDSHSQAPVDALNEAWAQALPAFPVEGGSVAGSVQDAQGRINLNNPGLGQGAEDALVLQRLLAALHLDPMLVSALRDWVDADDQPTLPGGAEDIDYLGMTPARRAANRPLNDVDELLRVRGFTPDAVARLRPYVTALPIHTAVNVNTAPAAVLAAVFALSSSEAEVLVSARQVAPFTDPADLLARGPPELAQRLTAADATRGPQVHRDWDVSSQFFQIDARATYAQVQYGLSALVRREDLSTYPSILCERRTLF
jgi:general secretion pathway protein K